MSENAHMSDHRESSETRIALSNQKGGSAKTTDTIHLAGALADRGQDVLAVDIDYHGGLTCAMGYQAQYENTERTTLFECLNIDNLSLINDAIISHDEFDILPASENLANNNNRQTLLEAPRSRKRLGLALDELDRKYDTILIDTPPSLGILTDNALVASENVIIPVIPEELNANSLRIFSKQLRSLETSYGMDINRIAIVANRVEAVNGEHERVIDGIESTYDIPLITVRKRTDLSQSIENDCSIFGFQKDNSRVRDARSTFQELAGLVTSMEVEQ